MEALEEVTHIVKGKRTKRQRPQSPIPFSIATHSSSSDGGRGGGINTNNATSFSPAPISNTAEEEEEEDMANCLILLAQGPFLHRPIINDHKNRGGREGGGTKSSSIKRSSSLVGLTTTVNHDDKVIGAYMYQCKTCNRTFSSFQALGGHRASHKKTKITEDKRPVTLLMSDDDDEDQEQFKRVSYNSVLSLQLSNKPNLNVNPVPKLSIAKVHECAICGAEFTSGQALGGHMRRHRGPINANTALSLSAVGVESDDVVNQETKKRSRNELSLDLDLNLPAPEDNHRRESKFAVDSKQQKQQQQRLVLSTAPALVDCHY